MKTKLLKENLSKLPLGKSTLFVSGDKLDENFNKALKNIPMHDLLPVQGANVYDILRRETLVLSKASAEALVSRLAKIKPKIKKSKEVK
jgi:large subunit ribosomal protein L4